MIKEENTRINIIVSKKDRDTLKKLANKENRSVSNLVNNLIIKYIEENK
ncbi:TPA: hypothetical protein REV31_000314 [Staphylococcus pseudintermedius]|nr:hypothetical protein [Staphylococcus pseudintermedius]MDF0044186.1 hypothetical protein [Staphylococcus pseudintermedius]MDF0048037.1 hypothetical protein [Staphylococcus pseudintermedius]PPD61385.1 hypothetical protein CYI98_002275 [Staphylococcus pseudintermedius]HDU1353442.1 hypothetical protein [Staphylococcus pseudintermedius]